MIDLHERLSEFSYGYGVTREVQALLESVGLHATPFMPSLLHEAELGFDVTFFASGTVVVLQFKLGVELSRFRRSPPTQAIPLLARPFWRFLIDVDAPQFQRLIEFANAGAEVYYTAPRFSSWAAYDRAFQDQTVLDNSLLVTPAEIARGAQAQRTPTSVHRIIYDRSRRYVCSEPTPIQEQRPGDLAERVGVRAREPKRSLEAQIALLFERPRGDRAAARMSGRRQQLIFARAKRPIDAMATIVGLEAWSQGAQLLFVTADAVDV